MVDRNMTDNFVNLHTHCSYSFQDGLGLPDAYTKRVKEIGQPGIGITDHGNVSSHYKWYKECKNNEIIPILGCEMYIVKNKEEIRTREYNHITILAKNNTGYTNLMKLVTKSWCENFYYKPRITWQELFDHQEGLIVLSGCLSSPFGNLIKENRIDEAEKIFDLFKKNIKNFYVEIQPIKFKEGNTVYKQLISLYKTKLSQKGFKGVITSDCHYIYKEQSKVQEILLCIQTRDKISNPNHWKFDQDDFYLKTRKEMENSLQNCFPEWDFKYELDETVKICEMINFTFPTTEPVKFPYKGDKIKYLKDLCKNGMKKRKLDKISKYTERIKYEFDLVVKKNFIDYFLVIYDLIKYAKENGILVGPARGSAAGSLMCYVLEITEVDPLKYGLIFERFIDINREDLPDIDIDFEDERRHEVKEYLEKKHGADKVCNLPTFAVFQGKSAIDDVRRVFELPIDVCEKVKHAIIERSGGDSRASYTLEDTFNSETFDYPKKMLQQYPQLKYSMELEGQLRQMGQHAAGVMISNKPITDFCAMYKVRGSKIISLEYKDASAIGLLKIDLLGLNTLSVISKTVKLIKKRHNKEINPYNIPLDDPKVYKAFNDGKMFGIFQFDGQSVNQVCRQIKPKDFESLSAISALARPGPLNSGNTTEYIMRRTGKHPVQYVHPIMESITNDSYGVTIYQEQVMRIMREIGKMSWKDTAEIRKLISRSQGVEKFNTFKDKFMPGAIENGIPKDKAEKIWEEMCSYGSWSFNKSHSVSYTLIGYWTQWLKVYYPMEFYSSILSLCKIDDKKHKIIKEYKKEEYKILSVDINKSKESFTIDGNALRIGFKDIKGIGTTACQSIISKQPFVSYTDYCLKTKGSAGSEKVKKLLVDLGAFDNLKSNFQVNLFGEVVEEFVKEPISFSKKFSICPWDTEFGIDKNWLSFIMKHRDYFKELPTKIKDLKDRDSSKNFVIYGIVHDRNLKNSLEEAASKGKKVDEKKLQRQFEFANFMLEDDTDFITVRLTNRKFPEYGKLIFEDTKDDDVVMIRGYMGKGIRMFFADKIINLRQYKEKLEKNELQKIS